MARYVLSCVVCKASFEAGQPWSKFCSVRCKSKAAIAKLPPRICIRCGVEYAPTLVGQRYCGQSCAVSDTIPDKVLTCTKCGVQFEFHGRTRAKYCEACRKIAARERGRRFALKHGKIKNPGVGSGGAQYGAANSQWKGGYSRTRIAYAGYRRCCFKIWQKQCVCCLRKDRVEVHHIDGNPHNNYYHNLIPLCWDCHRIVHAKPRRIGQELITQLNKLWPNCRSKIAEKIGEALRDGVIRPEDPRLKPGSWATTS